MALPEPEPAEKTTDVAHGDTSQSGMLPHELVWIHNLDRTLSNRVASFGICLGYRHVHVSHVLLFLLSAAGRFS